MKKMMFLSKNCYFSVQKALIYYTVNKSHHNSFILLVFSHVANFRYVANFRFLTLTFDLGWITVLYKWLNCKDLALSLYASKALANLDRDFGGHRKYQDGVYLYYPRHRFRLVFEGRKMCLHSNPQCVL